MTENHPIDRNGPEIRISFLLTSILFNLSDVSLNRNWSDCWHEQDLLPEIVTPNYTCHTIAVKSPCLRAVLNLKLKFFYLYHKLEIMIENIYNISGTYLTWAQNKVTIENIYNTPGTYLLKFYWYHHLPNLILGFSRMWYIFREYSQQWRKIIISKGGVYCKTWA